MIIGISIGFVLGVYRATQGFIERIVNQPEEIKQLMARLDSLNKTEEIQSKDDIYKIEWHDNICYIYDSNDNFVAQGASEEEAHSKAVKRFPDFKKRTTESKEFRQ